MHGLINLNNSDSVISVGIVFACITLPEFSGRVNVMKSSRLRNGPE